MWAIILHGGAKEIAPEKAEAALRVLEGDPTFNCGHGSLLNAAGEVEMCAAVMEGKGFNVGAVSIIQGVRHPVSVARAMLHEETILIAGSGARDFVAAKGVELCDPADLKAPQEEQKPKGHDTVGCIALNQRGLLVAATSTGGLKGTPPGRVKDSALPGCGYHRDDDLGAVAFSGNGERIARKMLAARAMHALDTMDTDAALDRAIRQVADIGGKAGGIALTPDGRFGRMHNNRDFAVAHVSSEAPEPQVFLTKDEQRGRAGNAR